MSLFLGVDAGGTRSTALVVDASGQIRGRADGGPANYQSIGEAAARRGLADVVDRALVAAGARAAELGWAAYGIAGADRPKDFEAIQAQLPSVPLRNRRTLVNDSQLALRAGTPDGVGVAVVAGTGTNALGRSPDGRVFRVGGYAGELGDFGSAGDIGREGLRAAMRGREGRGTPTKLYERLCEKLGLDVLEDIIDLWIQNDPAATDFGRLAPTVFETAAQGDLVSLALLARVGRELALSARIVRRELFEPGAQVTVVLGGSVLQRGADPTVIRTVSRDLASDWPTTQVVRLETDPVIGAVLLAHDAAPASREFAAGLTLELGSSFARAVE
jgi:N-acetylglucosamine kinase-like BadF-type ATPase